MTHTSSRVVPTTYQVASALHGRPKGLAKVSVLVVEGVVQTLHRKLAMVVPIGPPRAHILWDLDNGAKQALAYRLIRKSLMTLHPCNMWVSWQLSIAGSRHIGPIEVVIQWFVIRPQYEQCFRRRCLLSR